MKGWTRRGGRTRLLALVVVLSSACGEGASEGGSPPDEPRAGTAGQAPAEALAAPPANGHAAGASAWEATVPAHAPRGFRPAAWEDERTLVGLARSRIVRIRVDTAQVLPGPPGLAWSVDAAPGVLSWTNEAGWWIQRADGDAELRVPIADAPPGTDGPPEVLWSPDGSRALLTWSGEGAAVYGIAEVAPARIDTIAIRLAGYTPARPLLWLSERHVLLDVRALARRDGSTSHTESGQRGELAVYDAAAGVARLVAAARDDRFLRAAGLVAADSLLVLEHDRQGGPVAQWVYDTRSWQRRPRPLPPGRAFPHTSGRIAVITSEGDGARLLVVDGPHTHHVTGVRPGDAEPVVWAPDGRRLALVDAAQEPGRLVLVEERTR